jgi:hypothetical protein
VGDPRSYKWLNTIPITKVWEQMNLAHEYGANQVWIVNVGDLKPMELEIHQVQRETEARTPGAGHIQSGGLSGSRTDLG